MTVSLPIALAVGDVRGYCVLSNHCHIQILDVSHDLLNGFVSGLPFSSPPSPSPIGRPDTQAIFLTDGDTTYLHLRWCQPLTLYLAVDAIQAFQ